MRCALICTLFSMMVSLSSCGQHQTNRQKNHGGSVTKSDIALDDRYTSYHTMYGYADSTGKGLIIKNSFPKGELYTAPDGTKYVKAIFWTQIINNTKKRLELAINFSGGTYDFVDSARYSAGRSYKLLVPPDTMRIDKERLVNFGLTDIGPFVISHIDKPTSLNRTINPSESTGVYVIRLAIMQKSDSVKTKVKVKSNGVTRAGFSLKGQNLIYTLNGKEFHSGSINLKYLKLKDYHKVGI